MFLILYRLAAASGAKAAELRPHHQAHVDAHGDRIMLAGPTFDDAGQPAGGLFILDVTSAEDARAFVEGDPFVRAGILELVRLDPFRASRAADRPWLQQ